MSTATSVPRWLPSPVVIFAITLAGVLFAAVLAKGAWDTDYFWHITTGQLIAEGRFPTTDPFSFTWAGMPWTLHEWVSELVMYRLVNGVGYMGTVVVFAVLPGITFTILAFGLSRLGVRISAIAMATTLSALVLIPYMTVRPQVISWIFFAILMVALLHLSPQRRRCGLLALPFFALWANLHGLWAVGLGVLGLYVLLTLAGITPMAATRRWTLAGFAAAVLGTALTPAGPAGVLYPLRYIEGGDWGLANITEWQSPDFHEAAHLPLLLFILAVMLVGRRTVPLWLTLFAWLGIAMALLALRNAPIAGIIGLPAVAIGLGNLLDGWRPVRPVRLPSVAVARRVMEMILAAFVLIGSFVLLVPPSPAGAVRDNIEENLPVQSVDLLLERQPDARVAAEYGWGGYVINRLFPTGGRVMVDGRNDMYDQSILETYGEIREAGEDWAAIADRFEIDALLFPPDKTITKGPAESAGWCEAYRDENEVLYLRSCPRS